MGQITHLYHYPFTDLSAQALTEVSLTPGSGFPADRLLALARPGGTFDPMKPREDVFPFWRSERHVNLISHYDPASERFTLSIRGRCVLEADLSTAEGIAATAAFFARMYDWKEPLTVARVKPTQRFTEAPVSLINLASVENLAGRIGRPVDPLRFRANLYFDGWPAQSELDLPVGTAVQAGTARLRVIGRTQRCNVTEIDPVTAKRDIPVPRLLKENFGHGDLGIYCEVVAAGIVRPGDPITPE